MLFPVSAEFSFYGSLITSLGGGQHRICLVCGEAAALPNALGGAWPRTPFSGRSPYPLEAASVSAETLYPPPAAQLQRGTSPPLRNPQLSEGTKEMIPER